MDWISIAGLSGLAFAWAAATFFIGDYAITSKWEDSYIGRNIMAITVTLWIALTNSGIRVIWPELPGRRILGTILIWLIGASLVQRILAFRRARREGRAHTPDRVIDKKSPPSKT